VQTSTQVCVQSESCALLHAQQATSTHALDHQTSSTHTYQADLRGPEEGCTVPPLLQRSSLRWHVCSNAHAALGLLPPFRRRGKRLKDAKAQGLNGVGAKIVSARERLLPHSKAYCTFESIWEPKEEGTHCCGRLERNAGVRAALSTVFEVGPDFLLSHVLFLRGRPSRNGTGDVVESSAR